MFMGIGMRTLYLLRHAKSSWADPSLADHDRPLNGRGPVLQVVHRPGLRGKTPGRRAAPLMGAYLREGGHRPDLVLCSTAARTRETLAAVMEELDVAVTSVDESSPRSTGTATSTWRRLNNSSTSFGRCLTRSNPFSW